MAKKQPAPATQTVPSIEMPSAVIVCGKPYTILCEQPNATPDSHLNRNDMGACHSASLRIYLHEGFPVAVQQDTLLHETLHAVDQELYLGMTEQQVANVATVLLDVLRRNKQFTAYLLQD